MDPPSWNALILKHANIGQGRHALKLYEDMKEAGCKPSSYTFVAALKACSSLRDLQCAKKIHAEVVQSGFELDLYVGSMLVDVYTKCWEFAKARDVFNSMPCRNVVSWTAMILGYAQVDKGEVALELYAQMQQEGLIPNERTFVAALKACSCLASREGKSKTERKFVKSYPLEQVRIIHSDVVKRGFEADLFVGTMLVDVYAKCGCLVDARRVFEKIAHRSVISWTVMILGYAQMNEGDLALELYNRMLQEGVEPSSRTLVGALKAYSGLAESEAMNGAGTPAVRVQYLEQVRIIHSQIVQLGWDSDVFVGAMLVDVFAKCGSLVDARRVFEKIPHRDLVPWNAMILGYAQMGEGEEALHLYKRLQKDDLVPNDRTFVGALKACISLTSGTEGSQMNRTCVDHRCLKQVQDLHSEILKTGWESDVYVGTMLVDAYVKCGGLVDARSFFDRMPERDVVVWTAMIFGYAQAEAGEVALQLYAAMQQEGITPNAITFVGALNACGSVAGLERGMEIHADIHGRLLKRELKVTDPFLPNALIDMYSKCGSMGDARKVFDEMVTRDVVTWNALIAGYARQGDSAHVFDLFERMNMEAVQPNGVTLLSVLTVCSHLGVVDKGQHYFEVMSREYGIHPTIDHYTCFIDLLARSGQVEQAIAMAKAMPLKPDGVVWHTLLDACRKWHNVKVGKEAFECAVRLDKNDITAYALLSSIYARCNMWENVKEIEAMRLESGAWKKPGHTWWTDIGGFMHAFVAGSQEHPESQKIYAQLQGISFKMAEEADVAQLDC